MDDERSKLEQSYTESILALRADRDYAKERVKELTAAIRVLEKRRRNIGRKKRLKD